MRGGDKCLIFPRRSRRAVVLCDGPPPPGKLVEYWLDGADLFVCADRAGHPYYELPRLPDVVIGDFDTLADLPRPDRSNIRFIEEAEQDTTDSDKALRLVLAEGCEEAVLLGATGWLLDHTLHNCRLPERYAGRLRVCLSDEHSTTVRIGPGETTDWELPAGRSFSLLPLNVPARGVDLDGADWPLRAAVMGHDAPTAISNRTTDDTLRIAVVSGSLLFVLRHEPPPLPPVRG